MCFFVQLEEFVDGQGRWEKTSIEQVEFAEDRQDAAMIAESRFPGQRYACVLTESEWEMFKND